MNDKELGKSPPVKSLFILCVFFSNIIEMLSRLQPFQRHMPDCFVERMSFDIESDSAEEIIDETETNSNTRLIVTENRETDQPSAAEKFNPSIEKSEEEIEHAVCDFRICLTP